VILTQPQPFLDESHGVKIVTLFNVRVTDGRGEVSSQPTEGRHFLQRYRSTIARAPAVIAITLRATAAVPARSRRLTFGQNPNRDQRGLDHSRMWRFKPDETRDNYGARRPHAIESSTDIVG
jgi:hypothetical protein